MFSAGITTQEIPGACARMVKEILAAAIRKRLEHAPTSKSNEIETNVII